MRIVIKTTDAIKAFESRIRLAKALGITNQAISQWGVNVPERTAPKLLIINPSIKHQRIEQSA